MVFNLVPILSIGQSLSLVLDTEQEVDSLCESTQFRLIATPEDIATDTAGVYEWWVKFESNGGNCAVDTDPECLADSEGFVPLSCLGAACPGQIDTDLMDSILTGFVALWMSEAQFKVIGTYKINGGEEEDFISNALTLPRVGESNPLTAITANPSSGIICEEDTVLLTANGVSCGRQLRWYLGHPDSSGILLDTVGFTYLATDAGRYFVREELPENDDGMGSLASFEVVISSKGTPLEAISPSDTTVCNGLSIDLTALGGETGDSSQIVWYNQGEILPGSIGEETITVIPTPNSVFSAIREGCVTEEQEVQADLEVVSFISTFIDDSLLLQPGATNDLGTYFEGQRIQFEISSDIVGGEFSWSCEPLPPSAFESFSDSSETGNLISLAPRLSDGVESGEVRCEIQGLADPCNTIYTLSIRVINAFDVPNIITPNGDGFNDTWDFQSSSISLDLTQFTVKVYSRQGTCVYGCNPSQNLATAWTGEDCPDGPYWYLISGPNGFEKKGAVTLLRD